MQPFSLLPCVLHSSYHLMKTPVKILQPFSLASALFSHWIGGKSWVPNGTVHDLYDWSHLYLGVFFTKFIPPLYVYGLQEMILEHALLMAAGVTMPLSLITSCNRPSYNLTGILCLAPSSIHVVVHTVRRAQTGALGSSANQTCSPDFSHGADGSQGTWRRNGRKRRWCSCVNFPHSNSIAYPIETKGQVMSIKLCGVAQSHSSTSRTPYRVDGVTVDVPFIRRHWGYVHSMWCDCMSVST